MPQCAIHQTEMRLFTPKNGAPRYTCPTLVGVGQPNTNAKGYCNYQAPGPVAAPMPVAVPAAPSGAIAPQAVSGAAQAPLRVQAAFVALECASRLGGTVEDVKRNTRTFYHELLKPTFMGDMPKNELPPGEGDWNS